MWLGVAVPGDTVGNFGSALEVLSQRATYLYVDSARYWYDTQASATRTAQDHAERLREHPEEVWAELVRRLTRERGRSRGDFAAVHACPDDSGAVPDTEEAKLVIAHPRHPHGRTSDDSTALRFAQQCLETRGPGQRTNRNTVVFLAPDERRMEDLGEAVRDLLAWRHVCDRFEELNVPPQQQGMAQRRRDDAEDTVDRRIADAYIWALVPDQPVPARPVELRALKAESTQPSLAERVTAKLRQEGLLTTAYGARNIRMDLDGPLSAVWSKGHIPVGELWSYYCRHPYLTRLRDRSVLDAAVRSVLNELTWEVEGFALAEGYDGDRGRYDGLTIPHEGSFGQVTDATLLVLPEAARRQQQAELPPPPAGDTAVVVPPGGAGDGSGDGGAAIAVRPDPPPPDPPPPDPPHPGPPAPENVRFFGSVAINAERYGREFNRIAQEVLQHLQAAADAQLQVRVEISATKPDGFADDTVRTVTENARTLRFDQFGFDDW